MVSCSLAKADYQYIFGTNVSFTCPFTRTEVIKLTSARRDAAQAQLLIFSEQDMMVSVNADPVFYEGGPIDIVRMEAAAPEGVISTIRLLNLIKDDDGQYKSDVISNLPFIRVPARKVQQVFCEFDVPAQTQAGHYEITLKVYTHNMFEDEMLFDTLTVSLDVVDYLLKPPSENKCYLDLWQHNANIARKYHVALWSDEHFAILENYIASMSALGQSAVTLIASEIPWSGQFSTQNRSSPGNLFEYNMARVTKSRDGVFCYDFSVMKRYIELCNRHGIGRIINVFGLMNIWVLPDSGYGGIIEDYPDAVRIRYLDETDGCYKYIATKAEFFNYIRALWAFFKAEGLDQKVRLFSDEPADVELFKKRRALLYEAVPDMKLMVAINHYEFISEDIFGIDDYAPWLAVACRDFNRTRMLRESIPGLFIYYTMGPNWPDSFVGSYPVENRVTLWLSWFLGLDGFLRWNYTVWSETPYETASYLFPRWRGGDCYFVYPGPSGVPELSLRYVMLKKAVRDFELFSDYATTSEKRREIEDMMREVFFFNDPSQIHPDARRKADELFCLDSAKYDEIINRILERLADGY